MIELLNEMSDNSVILNSSTTNAYSSSPPLGGFNNFPNNLPSPVISCIRNIMEHSISSTDCPHMEWVSIIDDPPPSATSLSKLEVAKDIRRIVLEDDDDGSRDHDNILDDAMRDDSNKKNRKPCVQFEKNGGAYDVCPGEIDIIHLPISLAILYQVTREVHQTKVPCVNILAMLEGIASFSREELHDQSINEYRAKRDACYRLFMLSKETCERMIKKRDKQKLLLESKLEEENRQCTFHPDLSISGIPKERERLSINQFIHKCYEWERKKMKKVNEKREKAIKDEDEDIDDTKLKMSETSKAILKRRTARVKREAEDALMVANLEAARKREALLAVISPAKTDNKSGLLILEKTPNEERRVCVSTGYVAGKGDVSIGSDSKPVGEEFEEKKGCTGNTDVILSNIDRSTDLEYDDDLDEYEVDALPVCIPGENHLQKVSNLDSHCSTDGSLKKSRPKLTLRVEGNTKARAPSDPLINPTFRPVTAKRESQERFFEKLLKHLEGDLVVEDEISQSVNVDDTVTRLTDDVGARIIRHEKRCKEHKRRLREQLYDPSTGQRLFHPNSMPTVLIDKKRVPIDQLPPYEKSEAVKALKQKHLYYLLNSASSKGHHYSDLNDFLRNSAEMQLKAHRRIEKIRRLDEKALEGLFSPKIDPNSYNIVAYRSNEKIYQRELPKKVIPPPPEKVTSDSKSINAMLERQKEWEKRRKTHILRSEKRKNIEEMSQCTFSPNIRSDLNQKYTDAAEQRLKTEVAMLKAQQKQYIGSHYNDAQPFHQSQYHYEAVSSSNNLHREGMNKSRRQASSTGGCVTSHNNTHKQYTWSPNSDGRRIPASSYSNIREESYKPLRTDEMSVHNHLQNINRKSHTYPENDSGAPPPIPFSHRKQPDDDIDCLMNDWEELDILTDRILQKVDN